MQEDVPEKMSETLKLWDMFKDGKYDVYLSTVTLQEIDNCPEPKRTELFKHLGEIDYTPIEITEDMLEVAQAAYRYGNINTKEL